MDDERESQAMKAGRLAAMGTEFGVSVVVGVVAGYYIDAWLGTSPLFLLVLSAAAFGGALYRMVTVLRRLQ